MTRPDKNFAARLRTVDDPVRLLGMIVRVLGPLHPDGNEGALIRRVQRVYETQMRMRRLAYGAAKRERNRQDENHP